MNFSRDGRYLATISSLPDARLTVWDWDREGEPMLFYYFLNKEK